MQFSSGWVSEIGSRGDALLELVDCDADVEETVEDDEFKSFDFFSEPSLVTPVEQMSYDDPDRLQPTDKLLEDTYVAALCCVINGHVAGAWREVPGEDPIRVPNSTSAPQELVVDDCALLRKLLLRDGSDEASKARHIGDLLPRAMTASAEILAELEVQLWM